MRYEEYIKQITDDFTEGSLIKPDAFPAMELYADQVAGFFDEQLRVYAAGERGTADATLTEADIAGFVKRGVLPRPIKKKYTRDHVVIAALLFYMKSAFRPDEIERVMRPFIDNHDSAFDDKIDFHRLYATIEPVLERERARIAREIKAGVEDVKAAIRGEGLEDDDNTELLLLLLSLAARADTAKYVAQRLLNEYFAKPAADKKK
ncbi:MAG: DUF1836 domain-containing protein [Clostridiales Family XIII bacterium]|jgi:hypothetical protein|nr:DUF1836 domain-containing protein [Clostridiales Family XIII bacterium]